MYKEIYVKKMRITDDSIAVGVFRGMKNPEIKKYFEAILLGPSGVDLQYAIQTIDSKGSTIPAIITNVPSRLAILNKLEDLAMEEARRLAESPDKESNN